MNELFDLGRPSTIELAVLYDRGGRKPIQPTIVRFIRALHKLPCTSCSGFRPTHQSRNYHFQGNMKFNTQWTRNHLIGIEDLTASEINIILETASSFKKTMLRSNKKLPTLRGRTLVNFFMEPSTRTRMAFEVAAGNLSADVITITGSASSRQRGNPREPQTILRR